MKTFIIFFLMLEGCAQPDYCEHLPTDMKGPGITKLYIDQVDPSVQPLVGAFAAELNQLANFKVIQFEKNDRSYDIMADIDSLSREASAYKVPLLGFCSGRMLYVWPSGSKGYPYTSDQGTGTVEVPSAQEKTVLAHELGHAMGLVHTDTGIMVAHITADCVGHEAQCLLDALHEQGKM